VHLRQPCAPRGKRDPQAANDDDELYAQVSEQSGAAVLFIGPERERDTEREYEDQSRSTAYHRHALHRPLLGAAFLLTLQFLEGRRRLGRKSFKLPLDFFQLY